MKALKIILGIILCFGLFATLFSFFSDTIYEESPEVIGHLLLIGILILLIYICFKPSKRSPKNDLEKR